MNPRANSELMKHNLRQLVSVYVCDDRKNCMQVSR